MLLWQLEREMHTQLADLTEFYKNPCTVNCIYCPTCDLWPQRKQEKLENWGQPHPQGLAFDWKNPDKQGNNMSHLYCTIHHHGSFHPFVIDSHHCCNRPRSSTRPSFLHFFTFTLHRSHMSQFYFKVRLNVPYSADYILMGRCWHEHYGFNLKTRRHGESRLPLEHKHHSHELLNFQYYNNCILMTFYSFMVHHFHENVSSFCVIMATGNPPSWRSSDQLNETNTHQRWRPAVTAQPCFLLTYVCFWLCAHRYLKFIWFWTALGNSCTCAPPCPSLGERTVALRHGWNRFHSSI